MQPRAGATSWFAYVPLLGLLLALAGCKTAAYCDELGKCGGDFLAGAELDAQGRKVMEWVATNPDSCMDRLQLPIQPVSIQQQPSKPAGRKGTGQSTVDWCMNLDQNEDGTVKFTPFFPIIPLKNAVLKISSDGTYDAHFTNFEPQQMQFSHACRTAQGVNQSCPSLGRKIKEAIAAESNVTNMRCFDDGEGGCLCDYELLLLGSLPGTYADANGVVTFFDESLAPAPPAPADYCVKNGTFELTGRNGLQLFNRPNLRTLVFHPRSCSDKVQNGGETGIDCGGPCGGTCPSCTDDTQNGEELGVDCGGTACPDMCECFNGVQDKFEDGPDCGGPCPLLCSCINGVQDANEEGVDCGGDCRVRSAGDAKPCP